MAVRVDEAGTEVRVPVPHDHFHLVAALPAAASHNKYARSTPIMIARAQYSTQQDELRQRRVLLLWRAPVRVPPGL